MVLVVLLMLWNFGVSWLNCWFVGRTWAESKVIGGWTRLVTLAAAVMGASGFVWCNMLALGFLASTHAGLLPPKYELNDTYLGLLFNMGYALVIVPILGSGLAIWADSVKRAYKNRDGVSIGVAGYNTFAMAYDTYEAAKFLPSVLKSVGKTLESTKDARAKLMLATVYAVLALSVGLGIGLAYYIIHSTAVKVAQNAKIEALEAQVAAKA